jgi:hypothetical protein
MDVTTAPYKELFVTDAGGGLCGYICNQCGRNVDHEPCPEHAPVEVPGLQMVHCDARPRHRRMWVLDFEGIESSCPYCQLNQRDERIAYLERCRHWSWRRSRLTRLLAGWAYALGIVAGYAVGVGGCPYGHHGCVYGFRWLGRRSYILGWPRWKWHCLLVAGHWPGPDGGTELCGKCFPCPDCGSTTSCFTRCERAGGER